MADLVICKYTVTATLVLMISQLFHSFTVSAVDILLSFTQPQMFTDWGRLEQKMDKSLPSAAPYNLPHQTTRAVYCVFWQDSASVL